MKNNFTKILFVIFTAIGILGFFSQVKAVVDPLVVEFENTPHLFSETNFLPGQSVTRWVKVTNNSGGPQRIATEAINYPEFVSGSSRPHPIPAYDLSRALLLVIREKGGSDLYGGSTGQKFLYDFYQNGETYFSDIPNGNGGYKEYEFVITFPPEKENDWQDKTTRFDVLIGFQGAGGGLPPGGGSSGGGAFLPPGLTIKSEKEIYIAPTTVTFFWETSYPATSQVIYDTLAGKFNLNPATSGGPPNYGYAFSKEGDDIYGLGKGVNHQVTIVGLSPDTVYYYRTVSHGSLAISTEHSFITLNVLSDAPSVSVAITAPVSVPVAPKAPTAETPVVPEQPAEQPIEQPVAQTATQNPFVAAIGSFLTLGTGSVWLGILVGLIILAIIVYAIYALRKRKNSGKI